MSLFHFFKKKEKINLPAGYVDHDEENQRELEELAAHRREVRSARDNSVERIDFSKMVPGDKKIDLSDEEVYFLSYVDGLKVAEPKISMPWQESGIDFQKSLLKFFQAGLLDFEQATSTLERVPVADLKQFLSKNNIQPKGRKSEIIDTIIECIDKKVIAATFPPKAVTLTGKGAAIVAHKEKVDRDTRFRSSSADAKKHLQTGQLFAYCDDLMHIANIDIAENRYLDAIRTLLSRFCIEIVGIPDTGFFAREAEFREFNHKHKTNIHSCIVPYTVRTIRTAKENAHITELDFRKLFYAHVTKDAIPYGFCSVDEVYELVTLALDNPDAANERLSGFIARFKKRNKLL